MLVEGVKASGSVDKKFKFLRKVPMDPMTHSKDWGKRSVQDHADSQAWGGQNVFDVYTKTWGESARRHSILPMVMKMKSRRRGFTLIEIMIVMTIVSILFPIAVPLYQASILRAKESMLGTACLPCER